MATSKSSRSRAPDARWLDLILGPGEPGVRLDLTALATTGDVPAEPVRTGPGELLLDVMAAAVLATEGNRGGNPLPLDIVRQWTTGLGEIIAAFEAAGALRTDSPVPDRLATLCEQLDASEHGISAPPRTDLPDPWASILAQYRQWSTRGSDPGSAPHRSSRLALVLPEIDGARYALTGLHCDGNRTLLTVHAHGVTHADYGLPFGPERYPASSWWLQDDVGRWHVTIMAARHDPGSGEKLLQLWVIPSLHPAVTSLNLVITGQSARLRVRLRPPGHPRTRC